MATGRHKKGMQDLNPIPAPGTTSWNFHSSIVPGLAPCWGLTPLQGQAAAEGQGRPRRLTLTLMPARALWEALSLPCPSPHPSPAAASTSKPLKATWPGASSPYHFQGEEDALKPPGPSPLLCRVISIFFKTSQKRSLFPLCFSSFSLSLPFFSPLLFVS